MRYNIDIGYLIEIELSEHFMNRDLKKKTVLNY